MPWVRIFAVSCLLVFSLLAQMVSAQPSTEMLAQGMELYRDADFVPAGELLRGALQQGGLTPSQQAQAHLHLGLIYLAEGGEEYALEAFRLAREADPSLRLNDRTFAPKVRRLFERAASNSQR